MARKDEEFLDRLRATFLEEAQDHLQRMADLLLQLEKAPASATPPAIVENLYREAHSFKGAARAVDFVQVESICQALESVLAAWRRHAPRPSREAFDLLHQAIDAIRASLAAPASAGTAARDSQDSLIQRLAYLQSQSAGDDGPTAAAGVASTPATAVPRAAPAAVPQAAAAAETVRIAAARLEERLLEAEDMLVVKAAVSERAIELRELVALLEPWRAESAKAAADASRRARSRQARERGQDGGSRPAAAPDLDDFLARNSRHLHSLHARLSALTSRAENDRRSVGRRIDDLLEASKKLVMLPFSTLAVMFPKLVRDLCREQGKQAELTVQGGDVELDKRIMEELKDGLIHALRNCVAHGVEEPQVRLRNNKPACASITVTVSPVEANKVEIVVADDGGGVDRARLKQVAVSRGILSEADARSMSDDDALELAFHSHISTSPMVTSLAGRGVGMAIVREKTEKLGGRVAIESRPGAGTTLRLVLPVSLTSSRGILVTAGGRTFVVPTLHVESVLLARPADVRSVENRATLSVHGRVVSMVTLQAVLGLERPQADDPSAAIPVLVLRVGEDRLALAVDELLREEEVLVKALRKPLARVRNIAGATVLGYGKVVPILNVGDLIRSARTHGMAAERRPAGAAAPRPAARILVVEDSVTSRVLLKGILESAGYQVATTVDGVEGYMALREEHFDLVVSDVEMPRMDGFDLTARIRADARLADVPVVLVTALESRAERERGLDAGANAYIVKSSFDQSHLLEVVERLL
ncbi:MAG TPA: response regulator [Candidatus Limnocylindrales bacterium]|nr:response regulator [Candidatus Limnocylindrales bacterium]